MRRLLLLFAFSPLAVLAQVDTNTINKGIDALRYELNPDEQKQKFNRVDSLIKLYPDPKVVWDKTLMANLRLTGVQAEPTNWDNYKKLYEQAKLWNDTVRMMTVCLNEGQMHSRKQDRVSALKKFYIAEKLATGRPSWEARAAIKIAEVQSFNRDFETAEKYLRLAEVRAKNTDDLKLNYGVTMAWAINYCLKRDWELAERTMLEAVDIADETKDTNIRRVAYGNAAIMYMDLGRGHIARLYMNKQDDLIPDDAAPYEKMSLLRSRVGTYMNMGMMGKTRKFAFKLLEMAEQMKQLEYQQEAYDALVVYYEYVKKIDSVVFYQVKYIEVTNTINDKRQKAELSKLQIEHDRQEQLLIKNVAQKKQELLDEQKLLRQETTIKWSIGGACLLLPSLLLLIRIFRKKRESNERLQDSLVEQKEQKTILEHKNNEIEQSVAYASRIQQALLEGANHPPPFFKNAELEIQAEGNVAKLLCWYSENHTIPLFAASYVDTDRVPSALMNMLMYSAFRSMGTHDFQDASMKGIVGQVHARLYQMLLDHDLTGNVMVLGGAEDTAFVKNVGWSVQIDGKKVDSDEVTTIDKEISILADREKEDWLNFTWRRSG